jgi:hypothetical protein
MKLVKVGGTIFISTPANNLCGHGFYQFSPELMFRVFTEENGFALRRLVMFESKYPSIELKPCRTAYVVTDPATVHQRVRIMSKKAVMMIVEAKKLSDTSFFTHTPLQSDYIALWNQDKHSYTATSKALLSKALEYLPLSLRTVITGYREKKQSSFSNTRFYRKRYR